ncbi:MAG: CehA/McbA family metallohydrolase [Steroidobacteraceae bacterium]
MAKLGAPVAAADARQVAALARQNDGAAVDAAEQILARYTLTSLSIDADGSSHASLGGAPRTLVEQGWRMFLVRVANPAERTEYVSLSTGIDWDGTPAQMTPNTINAQRAYLLDTLNKAPLIDKMWLLLQPHEATPIIRYVVPHVPRVAAGIALSGFPVEYRVIQLFSRDHGSHRPNLEFFTVGNAGEEYGVADRREFDFECLRSRPVTLGVLDADGRGCVASLTIKDKLDHVYPPQAMRLAPDTFFQEHIYRADGETMRLPDGEYTVQSRRGPEYLPTAQAVTIDADHARIDVKLQRWIDPAQWGWYSGDTHIHAAGCLHYQIPTEGVSPETMIRHVRGEGLSIGDVLTWGPSWYYQKQFFTGRAVSPAATLEHPELQAANNASLQPRATPKDAESILRYDVEVSGFPSSHAGHLVLLRLKEQDYPGTKLIEDWPSWNLPILRWARAQGAVAGYAHCGIGMVVDSTELPNFDIPPMDGNGTQEAIVDVTHGVVHFLSGCNFHPLAELNAWYHLLNCGFRLAFIGETDYPCLSGDGPGIGRSYVRLDHRPARLEPRSAAETNSIRGSDGMWSRRVLEKPARWRWSWW